MSTEKFRKRNSAKDLLLWLAAIEVFTLMLIGRKLREFGTDAV
jgi:hypothetical protein